MTLPAAPAFSTSSDLSASSAGLPRVLWVAPRPPVPPYTGYNIKSWCGLNALACVTPTELITFAAPDKVAQVRQELQTTWAHTPLVSHVLPCAPRPSQKEALRLGRFQFGLTLERSTLRETLDALHWRQPDRILLFADIVFAPLMPEYGRSAILSPHDCISEMMYSHFRAALPHRSALKAWVSYKLARQHEQRYYADALLTHLVTHRDRLWMENIAPRAVYHVLPHSTPSVFAPAVSAPAVPDDYDLTLPAMLPADASRPETAACDYDILVWSDLRVAPIAQGTREFLDALNALSSAPARRVLVVGKVAPEEAKTILGASLRDRIRYAPYLEDEYGTMQHGRITVIPDRRGAGIKNRCMSVLMASRCLACLYEQMHGLENMADAGAINAHDMTALAARVAHALDDDTYAATALRGGEMYARQFSPLAMRGYWAEMIQRAVALRQIG